LELLLIHGVNKVFELAKTTYKAAVKQPVSPLAIYLLLLIIKKGIVFNLFFPCIDLFQKKLYAVNEK
jgi:hypothetical protein